MAASVIAEVKPCAASANQRSNLLWVLASLKSAWLTVTTAPERTGFPSKCAGRGGGLVQCGLPGDEHRLGDSSVNVQVISGSKGLSVVFAAATR